MAGNHSVFENAFIDGFCMAGFLERYRPLGEGSLLFATEDLLTEADIIRMEDEESAGRKALLQGSKGLDKIGVVIPTYNAARHWSALRERLDLQGIPPNQVLIIDSSSRDETFRLAKSAGYQVVSIQQSDFNHGRTRQLGVERFGWAEILIYLTQDALPADDDAFRHLLAAFDDPKVGAACGRQLPRPEAGAIERHARLFNYPETSSTRTFASREELGIKAAFLSNSFAAYRVSALEQVGGFPANVIMAEDSVVAARLLMSGWSVAYVAEAAVVHSHAFAISEEFSRYFDTGVHHARERWILEVFGGAGGEGKRFLLSELSYLFANEPSLIPGALVRTAGKLLAYQLGLHEQYLPASLKKKLSLQPRFFDGYIASTSHPQTAVETSGR